MVMEFLATAKYYTFLSKDDTYNVAKVHPLQKQIEVKRCWKCHGLYVKMTYSVGEECRKRILKKTSNKKATIAPSQTIS